MEASSPNALERAIQAEIAASGPMPFARFMDLCLYHPELGYYARGLGGGGGRDYITSSGLHRAYGALMARQAEEMWRLAGEPGRFRWVEFGPGEGHFACDFLRAVATPGPFARALDYVLVEKSAALRARQQERIARWAGPAAGIATAARWADLETLERDGAADGCLFANEVLDAFPVHRLLGTPAGPREIRVVLRDGALVEEPGPVAGDELRARLADGGIEMADGQTIDLNLETPLFMSRIAALVRRGYAVIVDYGYEAADLYHPARRRGTLLAYHRHRATEDFLARPGEQDLTAHVDFTAVRRAAEAAGMQVAGMTDQSRFLLALGALEFVEDAGHEEREALKEMILPGRMGSIFRVLVLAKGGVPAALRGLSAPWRETAPPVRPPFESRELVRPILA